MFKKLATTMISAAVLISAALPTFAQDPAIAVTTLRECETNVNHVTLGTNDFIARRLEESMHHFVCATQEDPENAQAILGIGMVICRGGDPEIALGYYETVIEMEPEYAMAWNYVGWANYKIGNHEVAMEALNHAIALDPELSFAYNNRGLIYQAWGNLGLAVQDYEQAIQLGLPTHWASTNLYNAEYEREVLAQSTTPVS